MRHHMKRIGIIIGYKHMLDRDTKLCDLRIRDFIYFKQCIIVGAEQSLRLNAIIIYLEHNEFESVPEGGTTPMYWYEEARKKYPYLFAETNPLLYRRFNHNK
jgi:hypothetical protein